MILCSHNDTAAEHNAHILAQLSDEVCTFHSINITKINDDFNVHELLIKFLISLNLFRLSSAVLKLKIKISVMLLHCHCVETFIFSEQFAEQQHILYKVSFSTQKSDYLWIIVWKQFSIHLCFTIIINKFQKQSFSIMSLNVQHQCFSHEQLYVTLF